MGTKKVLVVDDDADLRSGLRAWCEQYGFRVIEAATAQEVLRLVKKHHDIDAVVMDGFLGPHMTEPTLELVRTIRPLVKGKIIAHTNMKEFEDKMRAAGCDSVADKGKPHTLIELIGTK